MFILSHSDILHIYRGSVNFHYLFYCLNLDFMGVRNKKSNDLFFGIMQSPQATLPKETLLMDIILYLLHFIQYQHKQICWLINLIVTVQGLAGLKKTDGVNW